MSSVARDLSKKSLETFLMRIGAQVAAVAMGIILARALGPTGKGLFAYAGTILALLLTISSGQSSAVSWQYGRNKVASSIVYAAMFRFFFIVVVPLSLTLLLAGIFLRQLPLVATALVFPCAYLNQVTLAFFLADSNVRWSNVQGIIVAGSLTFAIAIVCFLIKGGLTGVFIAWILVNFLVALRSLRRVQKYAQNGGVPGDLTRVFRQQLVFSMRSTFNELLWNLNYRVDLFVILAMLGAKSLGVYSIAVGVGELMWFISRPLAFSAYGRITSGTKAESAYLTITLAKHAIFLVLVVSVLAFFAGPTLIRIIYGQQFAGAGTALRWLLPGIMAYCARPFFAQFFTLQLGRPGFMSFIAALSTLICVAVTILLVPRFGIVAGAIGTSTSYVVSFGVVAATFYRETGISPVKIFAFTSRDFIHYQNLARETMSNIAKLIQLKSA